MNHATFEQIAAIVEQGYNKSKQNNKHFLIGISGIDASGKSTLANRFSQYFSSKDIPTMVISGDDFFFQRSARYQNPDQAIGYYQESCDYHTLFYHLLIPLKESSQFSKTLTLVDWESDQYTQVTFETDQPHLVIVEGVFLYKKEWPDVFDYKIWIDCSFLTGVKRAVGRQRDLQRYQSIQAVKERYLKRFYPAQILHLRRDGPAQNCHVLFKVKGVQL